ncbi:MAG: coproporphyrinogen-III oxidase family protein, partial [Deinococcus sp.]
MQAAPSPPLPLRASPVVRHAYVHVPFCPSICPYCDFHVLERRGDLVERYLERLEGEAQALAGQYRVELDTLYLGGGTPSFLREEEMERLAGSLRRHLGWGRLENTLEVNPGTVSTGRAAHWRNLGFDRASVGVQSLHDPTLRFLGRQHSAEQGREAVSGLLEAGFRVSGDLITAVSGQPLDGDIAGLLELGVEHVSAYTLTVEPGTPFARLGVEVGEDDERLGFERTETLLTVAGFGRYELSNYARTPAAQSRHNRAYWTGEYFLGLGPSGAGFYPGSEGPDGGPDFRRTNPPLHEWLAGQEGEREELGPEDLVTDALFMGLRLREGVDLARLSRRSGLEVRNRYREVIGRQLRQGLLTLDGEQLRATPQGWWVLN